MVLPPSMQSSLPAGWLAFTGRELNPLDRYRRFQIIHPPFLDLAWRKGSFMVAPPIECTRACPAGCSRIKTTLVVSARGRGAMSPFGTERHFAAAQRFGRFRMRSGHADG